MRPSDLQFLLDRPIAFHRALATVGGGALSGLFLSQCLYWQGRSGDADGFWKTREQWEEETALTRWQQETVRKHLKARGLLVETEKGSPCRLYYRVDLDRLATLLEKAAQGASGKEEKPPTSRRKSHLPVGGNPTYQLEEKPPTLPYTETTTETTTGEHVAVAPCHTSVAETVAQRVVRLTYSANVTTQKAPAQEFIAATRLLREYDEETILRYYGEWAKEHNPRFGGYSLAAFARVLGGMIAKRTQKRSSYDILTELGIGDDDDGK